MKKVRPLGIGIVIGLVIGLVYGYSILSFVMRDTNSGIALGGLMGVGMASAIVVAIQSQERIGH
ncbi:MAG: hypothetical protein HZB51_16500 [Chloroflexi bacterium]|nr:hypothetical protein [Chloroflexota bacterium]